MMSGKFIEFENAQGHRLRGVLPEPAPDTARGICILLLSPGIKGRVGPHRLYLKVAGKMVSRGFHVLRFDYSGLGDSAGQIDEPMLLDVYTSIQTGRYVQDTISAMNWMQATHGIERFVGSGLCGGSISALLTAEIDHRIECLLGISLPTVLEGGPENWARILTQQQMGSLRRSYFRKLTDPKSWLRLLSGKSNFKVIGKILKELPRHHQNRQIEADPRTSRPKIDNTNPRFAKSFLSMLSSKRPMILIFSEADRLHGQFEENFVAHHARELHRFGHLYEVHVIKSANHILSDPDWVRELLLVSGEWLDRIYPTQ